jgi:uncharacterized protein YgbK (DUF1537 family)
MTHRCLVIADDFTGGSDTGAQFANNGLKTLLISPQSYDALDWSSYADIDALVVNTRSRAIAPEASFKRIVALLKHFDQRGFPVIYKKIDSTLRGNFAQEIDAVFERTGKNFGLVVPSFPEQGRILVGSFLLVNGKPLGSDSDFAGAGHPVELSIKNILESRSRHAIGMIDLNVVNSGEDRIFEKLEQLRSSGKRIVHLDAACRQDLTRIARAAFRMAERPVLAGSAGLAQEVAVILSAFSSETAGEKDKKRVEKVDRVLLVVGSQSPMTMKQIEYIKNSGTVRILELDPSTVVQEEEIRKKLIERQSAAVARSLKTKHTLLRTCGKRFENRDSVAQIVGDVVALALEASGSGVARMALMVTGGATAEALLDRLQASSVSVEGELSPGIVKTRLDDGKWKGLNIVSKAGGFGSHNEYEKILHFLEEGRSLGG